MDLDPSTTAVVAVHCQGDIVGSRGAFADLFSEQVIARNVIANIGTLLDIVRDAGGTVVYTRIAFAPDYSDLHANSPLTTMVPQLDCLKEGSELAEIVTPLTPHEHDLVITHQRLNGFTPELDTALRNRGITTVLFAGVATNLSVESAVRAAVDCGYRIAIVADACSAATSEAHEASIGTLTLLAEITSVADIDHALKAR